MAQFGYQVLGLAGYASRGIAVGVWTAESNGTGENKYAGAHAGTASSGLYAGGYSYSDGKGTNTFEWGGSSWSSGGSLNNDSHNSMGAELKVML